MLVFSRHGSYFCLLTSQYIFYIQSSRLNLTSVVVQSSLSLIQLFFLVTKPSCGGNVTPGTKMATPEGDLLLVLLAAMAAPAAFAHKA